MLVQGCIALFNLQSFSRDIQNRATAVSLVYSLFKVCVIIIQAVMSRECQADRPLWNNLWQGSLKPSDIFNWCGLQTAANYSNGNSEFNGHLSVSVLMFVSHLLSGYVSYMFWRCIVQFWMASTECLTGCGLAFTSWTHLRAGSGQTAPHSPSCAGKMVTVLFLFFLSFLSPMLRSIRRPLTLAPGGTVRPAPVCALLVAAPLEAETWCQWNNEAIVPVFFPLNTVWHWDC